MLPSQLNSKSTAQAIGITSNPTTTSTTFVPTPDLSVTHKNSKGKIKVSYFANFQNNTVNQLIYGAVFIDGVQVSIEKYFHPFAGGASGYVSDSVVVPVSPGTHKIDIYWRTLSGTATAPLIARIVTVEEVD